MPLTELWLSKVSRKRSPARNGKASPTRRSAPVAFGVKMATYSSGEAWKNASTEARAREVEVDVAARVEPRVLRPPELREQRVRGGRYRLGRAAHRLVLTRRG